MKRLLFPWIGMLMVTLSIVFMTSLVSAQEIPDLQGTWRFDLANTDVFWDGNKNKVKKTVKVYIYQDAYVTGEPNLKMIPVDFPSESFQGIVQGTLCAFYKSSTNPSILGLETLVGKVNKPGNSIKGSGVGFNSDPQQGIWDEKFHAKRINKKVP